MLNLCHNIIKEDICIERILGRFYKLENIYIILQEKKENSIFLKIKGL